MTKTHKPKQSLPAHAQNVFTGKVFDVYQWEQEMYDGSTKIFEKLVRPSSVNIIPVTTDGRIVYLEQEQPGKEPYIGFPAGMADKDEDVEQAAYRELLEESGLKPQNMTLLFTYQFSPKIDWIIYTYIATGCEFVDAQKLDGGEKIAVQYTTFDKLMDIILDPRFHDDEIALHLLKEHYSKEQWAKF